MRVPFQNLKRDTTNDEGPGINGNISVRQWMSHLISNVEEDLLLGDVLKEINGSSFKACKMINKFYKNNNE